MYKNTFPKYGDQQFFAVGEAGMFKLFGINDNFVVRFINSLLVLLLGSLALPLRLSMRTKIGERSAGTSYVIGAALLLYLLTLMSVNDYNTFTGHIFNIPALSVSYENAPIESDQIFEHQPMSIFYFYLGWFLLSYMGARALIISRRRKNIKWHSYYRGNGFLQWLKKYTKMEQTSIWMWEAAIVGIGALLLTNNIEDKDLATLKLLTSFIFLQSIALFIEELIIKQRRRSIILNMVDSEIESRIITEARKKLVEDEEEMVSVSKLKTNELTDVIIP